MLNVLLGFTVESTFVSSFVLVEGNELWFSLGLGEGKLIYKLLD